MRESLEIIAVIIPVIAGGLSIFFTLQLMKKFKPGFINSYFYFLVFLYIFGVYSLIGSGVLDVILARMEVHGETIRYARLFLTFLGTPFLILSGYMLIRTGYEFFSWRTPRWFLLLYFILGIAILSAYGIMIIKVTRWEQLDYRMLSFIQRLGFLAFLLLVFSLFYGVVLRNSRSPGRNYKKSFIRSFGGLYLIYMLICMTTFFLAPLYPVVRLIFLIVFLSLHLIPIHFLNIYLNRYQQQDMQAAGDFDQQLAAFIEDYEISPRETEVIKLICHGMSNKEISDSLFISLQTVKDHVHRIFLKTGVKNRVQLSNLIRRAE